MTIEINRDEQILLMTILYKEKSEWQNELKKKGKYWTTDIREHYIEQLQLIDKLENKLL